MSKTTKIFFAGLLAIVVGIGYLVLLPRFLHSDEARIRDLAPQTVATFQQAAPGSLVLIEGTISHDNEARYRSLVAYRQTSPIQGPDKQTHWVESDRVTPALLVDVPDGQIQLEQGYQLLYTTSGWQTKTYSYSGFVRGDRTIAVGRVTAQGTVQADFIAGGTRQTYLLRRMGETWSAYIAGVCSIVLGFLFVGGAFAVWRARAQSNTS